MNIYFDKYFFILIWLFECLNYKYPSYPDPLKARKEKNKEQKAI